MFSPTGSARKQHWRSFHGGRKKGFIVEEACGAVRRAVGSDRAGDYFDEATLSYAHEHKPCLPAVHWRGGRKDDSFQASAGFIELGEKRRAGAQGPDFS